MRTSTALASTLMAALLGATALASCSTSDAASPETPGPKDEPVVSTTACAPDDTASIQRTLFVPKCATTGCHTAPDPSASLDFNAPDLESRLGARPAEQCGGETLVVPGDPSSSYLLKKLADVKPPCGSRMPLGGAALSETELACVRTWVSGLRASDVDAGADAGPKCPPGETACTSGCTDTTIDKANCGSCGNACAVACASSNCVTSCPLPTTNCGGSCVDTTSTALHCGGCGKPCPTGQICAGSTCTCGASVSFAAQIQPILTQSCAINGCHMGVQPKSGLNLKQGSAYANLVNVPSSTCTSRIRVVPADVAKSYLVNKLTGVDLCAGTQMPKAGASLPLSEIDLVRGWICSGAPNN